MSISLSGVKKLVAIATCSLASGVSTTFATLFADLLGSLGLAAGQAVKVDLEWSGSTSNGEALYGSKSTVFYKDGGGTAYSAPVSGYDFSADGSGGPSGGAGSAVFTFDGGTGQWAIKWKNDDSGLSVTHDVTLTAKIEWLY